MMELNNPLIYMPIAWTRFFYFLVWNETIYTLLEADAAVPCEILLFATLLYVHGTHEAYI